MYLSRWKRCLLRAFVKELDTKRKIAESLFAFLKKRGYEVVPKGQSIENNMAYSHPVIPFSDYSPWLNDQEFQDTFRKVGKNTLITEPQRMYELWQLAKEVSHLEGDMLEVGSWRGGSGALIAIASKAKENNTKVYLCDTFEGVVKAGELDNVYENQEHADTSDAIVYELIEKLNLKESVIVLKGIFPDDTAHHLENEKFKFCHIDVDVLFTQFGYANKVGNTEDVAFREKASKEKLQRISYQNQFLKPKTIVPFASFIYFCHEENSYMNEGMNRVDVVHDFIQNELGTECVVMYPGDEWQPHTPHDSQSSISKYLQDYESVSERGLMTGEMVSAEDLQKNGDKFVEQLLGGYPKHKGFI